MFIYGRKQSLSKASRYVIPCCLSHAVSLLFPIGSAAIRGYDICSTSHEKPCDTVTGQP